MNYKELKVSDFKAVDTILKKYNIENCDHCFSAMLIWSYRHTVEFSIYEQTLFMRTKNTDTYWYLSPVGEMEFGKAVELIISEAEKDNFKLNIFGLSKEQKDMLEKQYGEKFNIIDDRDSYDYIYTQKDLSTLPGKNYQKKRNHCSRFERENPNYTFHKIDKENVEQVIEFERQWCAKYNCDESRGLFAEQQGIVEVLSHIEQTDVFGAFIKNEDKILAFTLACPLSEDTVDIIVEKAYHDVNGAYAVINRDFAKNCLEKYQYIDREDDMGMENLRKAKLSYFPCEIREKYLAQYKR